MNLKPLDDRIVVKPNEAEQTTASGLVIPDTAKEKPQQGEVLAVGPGRWSDANGSHSALDVKVGDDLFQALRRHFDETQIVELTSAIATYNMVARFLVALGITPEA